MKILIVNFEYPPLGGGGGVATQQLAEELARRHEVHVLTTQHPPTAEPTADGAVHVHRVPVWGRTNFATATLRSMITFVPIAVWVGWRLTRQVQFDVINAQFVIPSGIPAALLARWRRIPFVISFIGGDIFDPSKGVSPHRHGLLRAAVRWVSRQAQRHTAISSDTSRRARQLHGITAPITVTPLGLVPHTDPKLSRSQLGLNETVPLFVSVGRLIPRKGYRLLLEAWTKVPEAQLLIIGSGPLRATLLQDIARLQLRGRARLTGFVPGVKKRQLLQVADGYVSATEHEGFGIVFLEAMAAGLPIVAPNDGGQTDFLKDEVNTLLVRPRDAAALANAVNRLLANAELRERMGTANKHDVTQFYLDKTAARFEAVLQEAVHAYRA